MIMSIFCICHVCIRICICRTRFLPCGLGPGHSRFITLFPTPMCCDSFKLGPFSHWSHIMMHQYICVNQDKLATWLDRIMGVQRFQFYIFINFEGTHFNIIMPSCPKSHTGATTFSYWNRFTGSTGIWIKVFIWPSIYRSCLSYAIAVCHAHFTWIARCHINQ